MNIYVVEIADKPQLVILQDRDKVGIFDTEKKDAGLVIQNPDSEVAETVFEMFKESFEAIKKEWRERS